MSSKNFILQTEGETITFSLISRNKSTMKTTKYSQIPVRSPQLAMLKNYRVAIEARPRLQACLWLTLRVYISGKSDRYKSCTSGDVLCALHTPQCGIQRVLGVI